MSDLNMSKNFKPAILTSPDWKDYALLDSGDGRKLERYGDYCLVRPEAEAIWQPALSKRAWSNADAEYQVSSEPHGGHWTRRQGLPERWKISYKGLNCWIQPGASRHVGVFPEQAAHWDWLEQSIRESKRPVRVLNLFGYTGLASLAAARAGAEVTHLDASGKVITWGKENSQLSQLGSAPLRWIKDDAIKFVSREMRRASTYDGLILDPPKFGRGPQGEVWDFYKMIAELIASCRSILSPQPLFIVLTAYAVKASSVTLYYALEEMMSAWKGSLQAGELAIEEQSAGRLLSTAVFARWKAN